jgi:hypothetical protein
MKLDLIGTVAAARKLKCSPSTIKARAKAAGVGSLLGGSLVFSPPEVEAMRRARPAGYSGRGRPKGVNLDRS